MDHSISRDPAISTSGAALKTALRQTLMAARHNAIQSHPAIVSVLSARLKECLERLAPTCVAFYWPINNEVDLREIIQQWLAENVAQSISQSISPSPRDERLTHALPFALPHAPRTAALPVVSTRHAPMAFHRWHADMPMQEGEFRIPVPAEIEIVIPDLLLVPCVGFDHAGYRLGYGGGFYDRTLAAMSPRPATLGIALSCTGVPTLPIEPHDIPLDGILTEDRASGLAVI